MKINSDHILEADPENGFQIQRKDSPNSKAGLQPKKLVIHATQRFRMADAVDGFMRIDRGSAHLILDRHGLNVVQMVPFNKQAQRDAGHDKDSVIIALDYTDQASRRVRADPRRHVFTVSSANKLKKVPLYPREQLDRLLELAVFLHHSLGLETVLARSEINAIRIEPGPAFPITQFRERLFHLTNGRMGGIIVTERLNEDASLRSGPGPDVRRAEVSTLPAGTPVSVCEEWKGWVRVEVLEEIDGNPWLVGWLEARQVESGDFEPEVRDHLLFTTDGRQYKFIPAAPGNFDSRTELEKSAIHYVMMHATTGTNVQSTLNTFTHPNSKVSAHLVIGRDGRVIQMVPFNRAAFHAGPGSWEEEGELNRHSIGIEVDNAQMLVQKRDGTFRRLSTIIPADQVTVIRHWKLFREKPWHKFTEKQRKVTFKVVQALARFYPVVEILEHERTSLAIRNDPGPLFPMPDLRREVLNRDQPSFKRFHTVREVTVFENSCFRPPDLEHGQHNPLQPPCQVDILDDDCNFWTRIKVVKHNKPQVVGRQGWIRKGNLKREGEVFHLTSTQEFYKDSKHAPCLPAAKLPPGTVVRVQKTHPSGWRLVATPEHVIGFLFVEGWVEPGSLVEAQVG